MLKKLWRAVMGPPYTGLCVRCGMVLNPADICDYCAEEYRRRRMSERGAKKDAYDRQHGFPLDRE